jgi:hypothetical protein
VKASPLSPFNENVIIEIYHREQVSLGKNINNEWMTLRSRNAPSPILIFTLMGENLFFIISSLNLMISE